MVDTVKARTQTYQKVEYSIFEATAKELDVSEGTLAKELGYSDTAPNKWKAEGKMPKVVSLACECLRRRRGNSAKHETWLVKVENPSQRSALEALCRGLGCEFVSI